MKSILTILIIQTAIVYNAFSQECRDYWVQDGKVILNSGYSVVSDACLSKLLATDESMEIPFELIQCRDYKMSVFTTFNDKAYLSLYDKNTGNLLYNNILNDTAQVFEFQVKANSSVRAIISLPNKNNKKVVGAFTVKPQRYCVGFKLETMITKR